MIILELKTCLECGRSYASKDGGELCKRCTDKKVEDDFKIVRAYLYDNPGADIKEVSRDTGVKESIILRLLREDRIEVVDEKNSLLKCTSCGKSIKSGKLCAECKKIELTRELKNAQEGLKKDLEQKMEKRSAYFSTNRM